jgi:small subunit ribosomal protein S4
MRIPKEKRERQLGVRLQLKGARSAGPKAAFVRKPYKPGVHGPKGSRKALSDFGRQIMEKQKCKVLYGIDERTLRRIFGDAYKKTGSTNLNIIQLLESRVDSALFRMGFAPSRAAGRQLVRQGHILVNKKRVRAPGYVLRVNDIVSIRPESATKGPFKTLKETLEKYEAPAWLKLDLDKMEGRVISTPEDATSPFEVNLVVESFSK